MSFTNLNLRFGSVGALAEWLYLRSKPTWKVIGSTYHNTYIPNDTQWRGHASMESMEASYIKNGWSTGPHLYLAVGTGYDGIYMMCPPTEPGVHGVACNKDRFGIEVVGDFNTRPMSPSQQELLIQVLVVLHLWAKIGPNLNAHRDCVQRTCPGDAAYKQKPYLQSELARRLVEANNPWAAWGTDFPLPEAEREFGIPKLWRENARWLGAARSPEVAIDSETIIRTFAGGWVVYNPRTRLAQVYKRF